MTFKEVGGMVFYVRDLGGPGSGNWGHAGIPGYRGGSQKGSGGVHARPENYKEKKVGNVTNDKIKQDIPTPDSNVWGSDINIKYFEDRGYSTEESFAIADYKKNGYKSINKAALTGECEKYDCDGLHFLDKSIERSVINQDIVTYHGMGESESSAFDGIDVGSEFINKSFYSSSFDDEIADGFSHSGKIMVMNIPKGSNAIIIGDTKYENEVILPRNTKYKVNNIVDSGNRVYYHVSPVAS